MDGWREGEREGPFREDPFLSLISESLSPTAQGVYTMKLVYLAKKGEKHIMECGTQGILTENPLN